MALLTARIFAGVCAAWTLTAAAAGYPEKPIRILTPFSAGSVTDLLARPLAARLAEAWGQPVVVDNRAGGNAMIGADIVAKAPADGYAWLGMTITHSINATLFPQAPYNFLRDLSAVSVLVGGTTRENRHSIRFW